MCKCASAAAAPTCFDQIRASVRESKVKTTCAFEAPTKTTKSKRKESGLWWPVGIIKSSVPLIRSLTTASFTISSLQECTSPDGDRLRCLRASGQRLLAEHWLIRRKGAAVTGLPDSPHQPNPSAITFDKIYCPLTLR